jgi:rare lipoprotein A (peptidoglycan hydrolase)
LLKLTVIRIKYFLNRTNTSSLCHLSTLAAASIRTINGGLALVTIFALDFDSQLTRKKEREREREREREIEKERQREKEAEKKEKQKERNRSNAFERDIKRNRLIGFKVRDVTG